MLWGALTYYQLSSRQTIYTGSTNKPNLVYQKLPTHKANSNANNTQQ